MKKIFSIFSMLLLAIMAQAADIEGVVLDDAGEPLPGASIVWLGTGEGTATDLDGKFRLSTVSSTKTLVTSYVGYRSDTTMVQGHKPVTIVLVNEALLDEVTITERKMAVLKSRISAFDTQTLSTDELCKAACCNLSEAFETNASVDVAYADAATGAKQIKLLGLSGTYVQLLSENTPGVRGLAQSYGMEYVPGPWMQSIQVSKGTSSVINGYEATTGQINVEYLKPQTQQPVAINLMLNSELHAEANVMGGWQIPLKGSSDKLYTGILAHYQQACLPMNAAWAQRYMDENGDGFTEMPMGKNVNVVNRWFYHHKDWTMQAFVRGLYDTRHGGQMAYAAGDNDPYHIKLNTWRVEGFLKNGYVFDPESGSSVAVIAAASYHNQNNVYGQRNWMANQTNAYVNALYQGNFEGEGRGGHDDDHRLSAGVSVNYDRYGESVTLPLQGDTLLLNRQEVTPGVFAEYSYKLDDMLSLVLGVRGDYSTRYGFFCTPRMNVRYTPWEWWTIRASLGLGYRSPNVIADNALLMPSNRTIHYFDTKEGVTDAQQERALNTGVSTTFYIPMGSKQLQLSAEYYYTRFMNAVVIDMDQSKDATYIYNLKDINGQSFAHNAQIEASMEVLRGWTWTAAFRYTDVRQTTWDQSLGDYALRLKPLTNQYKAVITTSYQTPLKKWQFDLTAQFNGGGRMPDGLSDYYLGQVKSTQYYDKNGTLYYKWFPQLMAQITKYWRTCSLYVGAENMTNFRQDSPVVNADKPFDPGFDASMAWGPITGWKVYAGFRWALDRDDD